MLVAEYNFKSLSIVERENLAALEIGNSMIAIHWCYLLVIYSHMSLHMLRIQQNERFNFGDCIINLPIAKNKTQPIFLNLQ